MGNDESDNYEARQGDALLVETPSGVLRSVPMARDDWLAEWKNLLRQHGVCREIPLLVNDFGVTSVKIFMFYGGHGLHGDEASPR